ncbi:hypothetical protein EVAR_54936_1 [Eumeta japonica]|uniref:Uncharacterized protein n=1 Tax=Eumeta variegata TaxID=151549 RepID=A0A4C1YEC2_EUMVA|nr:hypothetical protein EVAR_54936_1 [Eumeta japonica]
MLERAEGVDYSSRMKFICLDWERSGFDLIILLLRYATFSHPFNFRLKSLDAMTKSGSYGLTRSLTHGVSLVTEYSPLRCRARPRSLSPVSSETVLSGRCFYSGSSLSWPEGIRARRRSTCKPTYFDCRNHYGAGARREYKFAQGPGCAQAIFFPVDSEIRFDGVIRNDRRATRGPEACLLKLITFTECILCGRR